MCPIRLSPRGNLFFLRAFLSNLLQIKTKTARVAAGQSKLSLSFQGWFRGGFGIPAPTCCCRQHGLSDHCVHALELKHQYGGEGKAAVLGIWFLHHIDLFSKWAFNLMFPCSEAKLIHPYFSIHLKRTSTNVCARSFGANFTKSLDKKICFILWLHHLWSQCFPKHLAGRRKRQFRSGLG